jgi:membrane protease subunit HflK
MPDDPRGWPPRPVLVPNPADDFRRAWDRMRGRFRGGPAISPWLILAVALVLWLASGFYIVRPDERGVVLRFGKVVRESGPGPGWHLPAPIEMVLKPSVTAIRKEEIGFRTVEQGPPAQYREVADESLMLTGDENIVKLEFIVQYRIRPDASGTTDFLFNVRAPEETVRAAAEASMREVMGRTTIDDVLTEAKERVQQDAQKGLQATLDRYGAGIEIVTVKLQDVDPPDQVNDAFKDVIGAQQDRERAINEALGYANDVVPRARGQAAQLVNEAEAYRESKTREATGAAQRFIAQQQAYAQAKDVTRQRLYLETMEAILPGATKVVLDDTVAKQAVPYLPLERFLGAPREPAPAGNPAESGGHR